MILGLDLGTSMGYSFLCNNSNEYFENSHIKYAKREQIDIKINFNFLAYGSIKFKKSKKLARTDQMLRCLYSIKNIQDIEVIAYEKVYRHTGSHASHLYGAYENTVIKFAKDNNIDIHYYSPTHIKKVFSDKGNATKQRMIYFANIHLGIDSRNKIKNDDEADAIAILFTYIKNNQKIG